MTNPKVEVLSIAQGATPDLQNVNKHTQRGRGLHENSMRKRGAGRSIFSAGKGAEIPVVMGGNQTLEIAETLGMEIINVHTTGNQIVNVVRDDIAPGSAEFYAMGIEDNEIGKLSYNPDVDILAAVMADPAMQALKAEDKMLADIVSGMGMPKDTKDAEPQTDRAGELAEKWQTASGQLWKLGDHRLLIGDCTVRENVERLMGGERAGALITDVPYGVTSCLWDTVVPFETMWNLFINNSDIDAPFVTTSTQPFTSALVASKFEWFKCAWVWNKKLSGNYLHAQKQPMKIHEDVCVFAQSGNKYNPQMIKGIERLKGGNGRSKLWDMQLTGEVNDTYYPKSIIEIGNTDRVSIEHPTEKPIPLFIYLIATYSNDKDLILEPFAGSGTTILAAHSLGRKCYSLELSEKYGAVILQRFLDATGIQPELVG